MMGAEPDRASPSARLCPPFIMVDTIFETLLHRKFDSIYSSLMMLRATMSERVIPVSENDDRGTFSMHALKRPQQFPNILKNLDSIAKMR